MLLNIRSFLTFYLLDIRTASFSVDPITIMLLYRGPSSSLNSFYNNLQSLLSTDKVIDIVLGDFYIFNNNRHLTSILSQYEEKLTEPTPISGSLIDHIYISSYSLQKIRVKNLK